MRVIPISVALLMAASVNPAQAQKTYSFKYIVTPSNIIVHALADDENKSRGCEKVDANSITPELVKRTGAMVLGWSYVQSDTTFGYVTWISEKSGMHTTFVANYIVANCTLTETRTSQKTFDGADRFEKARAEYNDQILRILGQPRHGVNP